MPDENKLPDEPPTSLPDLLQRSREIQGEQVVYRFGNGLTLKTEILRKNDRLRILPLGSPQGSLMNHMLKFPGNCEGQRYIRAICRLRCAWLYGVESGRTTR